jgi:hypothetical protein
MKTVKSLIVLLFMLLMAQIASAYYCPSTGRWLARDPISEPGFQTTQMAARMPASTSSRWLNRDPLSEPGFEAASGSKSNQNTGANAYLFVGNSPETIVDPYGLSVWSTIKGYCCKKAIDKGKDYISDKLKEWLTNQLGGESVDDAKKDCDYVKCHDSSDLPGKWTGACITCAIYKCAVGAATVEAAQQCLKTKLIDCNSGDAP